MTQLKTLNDVAYGVGTRKEIVTVTDLNVAYGVGTRKEIVTVTDLKQEAIKWIKELKKEGDLLTHPDGRNFLEQHKFEIINGKVEWIKHFFNISEEDLR